MPLINPLVRVKASSSGLLDPEEIGRVDFEDLPDGSDSGLTHNCLSPKIFT